MASVYASLFDMGTSREWLVATNVVLCMLLGLWMLRYRRFYAASSEEQANQRDLIENLSEGIYRSLPNGRQLSANKALVRLNGYDSEAEMLESVHDIGKEWYVDPGRRDEFRAILKRDGFVEDFVSEIYRHKTRERIWITESARLVRDKAGRPLFYEGSVRDITETMNRLRAEERLRKLSSQIPGGLFQIIRKPGGSFSVPYVSTGLKTLYGLGDDADIFDYLSFRKPILAEDLDRVVQSMRRSGELMEPWDLEFRILAGDGREKWLRVNAKPERLEDGIIWHGYINDISARKRNEMKIEKLAFYDPLTDLPNRRMFMDRMAKAVNRCAECGSHGALIFIDLDNFKTLNDTCGHGVGDEYLVQVARRLTGCVRQEDMVARIGGDEFVIILEGVGADAASGSRAAIMTASKVLSTLRDDFEVGRFSHKSSASLGVVVFDDNTARPEEILRRADIAMYEAKAAGRNGMALYEVKPATEADKPAPRRDEVSEPIAARLRA